MGNVDSDKYFHGRECKYGHGTLRFKSNGKCPQCLYAHKRRMHAGLPPSTKASALPPYELPADNPLHFYGAECRYGHGRLRFKSNRHCVICQREAIRKYRETLTPEELKRQAAYHSRNPQANLAKVRKYKADKANRVPPWADLAKIKDFYLACPNGMVVDHIIPLRGELVSGLHVHNNLQYLTPAANASKGNKFEVV
jgi:hypothetical protein